MLKDTVTDLVYMVFRGSQWVSIAHLSRQLGLPREKVEQLAIERGGKKILHGELWTEFVLLPTLELPTFLKRLESETADVLLSHIQCKQHQILQQLQNEIEYEYGKYN